MTTLSDLENMFAILDGCCLHDPQWYPDDVDEELAWLGDRSSCHESSSLVIVRLKPEPGQPSQFGLLTQWEDSSGHGCRCDCLTVKEPALHALLSHLSENELMQLIQHPPMNGEDDDRTDTRNTTST